MPKSKSQSAKEWRARNPEHVKEYKRQYNAQPTAKKRHAEQEAQRRKDPAYRAKQAKYKREWEKRPENKARSKQWYNNNKEYALAQQKARRDDPDMKLYLSLHRRRISGPNKHKTALYFAQHGKCNYCERRLDYPDLHVDHRIPLNQGGPDDSSNLQLLCNNCNIVKKDLTETPNVIAFCKKATLEACKLSNVLLHPKYA